MPTNHTRSVRLNDALVLRVDSYRRILTPIPSVAEVIRRATAIGLAELERQGVQPSSGTPS